MLVHLGQRLSHQATYAWWIAVVVYICIQAFTHIQVAQGRSQPTELDDTFTYTWQATRLDVCRQSCPALDTFAPILLTSTDDVTLHNRRVDGISRLLSVYAPLEEVFLLGVQRITGIEWGAAYLIFVALGVVLQALGIGLLLRALWGEWPAAISLIAVAFTNYEGQGLVYIVPANITLMIAMIVWAYLIKEGRQAWRVFLIGGVFLVLSHPIGRVYSLAALVLYVTAGHWWLTRREWGIVTSALAMIGGYWLFARISTAPPIDVTLPYVNPAFPSYFDLVRHQLIDVLYKLDSSLSQFTVLPHVALDAALFLFALTLVPESRQQRRSAWIFFALAVGMLVSAAFTSLPAYPNEGNRRLVIVFQIASAGGLGALIIWSLERISVLMTKRLRLRETRQMAAFAIVTLLVTIACFTWGFILVTGIAQHNTKIRILTRVQNHSLSREDLAIVLSQAEATILYTDEVSMLYGVSTGLHRFGGIYLHVLDTPPDLTQVDYIIGLEVKPIKDLVLESEPLQELRTIFPDISGLEDFVLVEGLKSDLRIYARRP